MRLKDVHWLKIYPQVISWISQGLAVVMLVLFVGALFNLQVFRVGSTSMEPAFHVGDIVFLYTASVYKVGEVITYSMEGDLKSTVTHRIVRVEEDPNSRHEEYITKGDANVQPDPNLVPRSRVLGRVVFKIPLLGYVVEVGGSLSSIPILIVGIIILAYSWKFRTKN